jgi:septum site-determining protein MinC
MTDSIAIKGFRDSLVITLPAEVGDDAIDLLLNTIDEQAAFFRGGRLAVEVGAVPIGAAELGRLRSALDKREVTLFAVLTSSEITREAAADLGLDLNLDHSGSDTEPMESAYDTSLLGQEAVLVERTLRSGNDIRHPGHVIVLGDVNPGAEVIAGGHVIVWGRLRGVVHAGAGGDEDAVICALDLAPTQLRIAGHIALSPEREGPPKPEIARVREGQIVAQPWEHARAP